MKISVIKTHFEKLENRLSSFKKKKNLLNSDRSLKTKS